MRSVAAFLAVAGVILAASLTAQAGLISGPLGNSGWMVYGYTSGHLGVAVDHEGTDENGRRFVAIEVIKVFTDGPDPQTGSLPPICLNFIQTASDEATACRLYVADEIITNLTGVDWVDFHWILGTTDTACFNREMTNPTPDPQEVGWHINPFTTFAWSQNPSLGTEMLSVAGGVVPDQSSFFPGSGAGNLVIDVNLEGPGPAVFTLKEIPTIPEPASLLLIGGGSAFLLLARRKARGA